MSEPILLRELTLIRHGESRANAAIGPFNNVMDEQDPLLTDLGLEQADLLGKYFEKTGEKFDAVYSSGLRRTVQTAAGILKHSEDKTLNIMPELCEIGLKPEYQGQTFEELSLLWPHMQIAEGVDATTMVVPDELPKEEEYRYFERAGRVLDYIDERYKNGKKIALVSHAGFLTYIIFHIIGYRDMQPIYDFRLSNTGVTKILFYEPGTNVYGDMVFDCVNERCHLS